MFRLLIADDEELERRALRLIIERNGFDGVEILEAVSGTEAVLKAIGNSIDAAFLDIRMPGLDGIDAARQIRAALPDVVIVIVTAFDSFDYAREAVRLNIEEYLVKPAEEQEVIQSLHKAMAASSIRKLKAERERALDRRLGRLTEYLESELCSDLALGTISDARLEEFYSAHEFADAVSFFGALKPVPVLYVSALESLALRKAILARIERLASLVLKKFGWYALASATESGVALLAISWDGSAEPKASAENILLEILARSRTDLGIDIVAGATVPCAHPEARFLEEATIAASLARKDSPLVLVDPAVVLSNPDAAGDDHLIERARSYMVAHLNDGAGLERVAVELRVSASHLSRKFRQVTGCTFMEYGARLRIDRAKTLLSSGLYSVKEVSSLLGFVDQAYFARVFRRLEGQSPTDYRSGKSTEERK
ncbi:MAG TPA: helix-turn-helix domain-containing protein [bacterium]|nr:helix-turn-helix domain-containing protein [bacterium]